MSERNSRLTAVQSHFDRLSVTGGWSGLYRRADGASYHFHVRRTRVLELLPEALGKVLDLGCGPGVMVEAVLDRGGSFLGVDYSEEMVREGRSRYGSLPGVEFRVGDIEALDLPDEAFDQVICMAVLEYLPTPDRALREVARVLRPGGTAVVTVPKRLHIDRIGIRLSTPFRLLGRFLRLGSADTLPRLCLEPAELDAAAGRAGLRAESGALYHFTPLPYPLTKVAPGICFRLNMPFERYSRTDHPALRYLAHGYVGRYGKPVPA